MDSISDRYVALAIQGKLRPAQALLGEAESGGLPATRELAGRFRARFIDRVEPLSPASGNALIDDIISTYRGYWAEALMMESPQGADDMALQRALAASLRDHGWPLGDTADTEQIHAALQLASAAEGFHALPGRAPPLQDLLVWRGQSEAQFEVELTDHRREVTVRFLSEFYSEGWKHYAALGLMTTSGWIEDGILYCVDQAYVPATETFEVSYLKHESRHLADREQFPRLPAADLEYRAKLTELACARATLRRLLEDFTSKSAADAEAPHAVANYRVTHDLYTELYGRPFPGHSDAWMTLNADRVNRAARRLLQRDSRARLAEYAQGESGPS